MAIKQATKKPVTIDYVEWTGDNLEEVIELTGRHESALNWDMDHFKQVVADRGLKIFTLEGKHIASLGDMIIEGVKGEHYPCKPDIFYQTYDVLED